MDSSSASTACRENPRYVQEILSFLTGPSTVPSTSSQIPTSSSSSNKDVTKPINDNNKKKEKGQVLIEEVLSNLTEAMVYLPSSNNMDTNRKLWDNYAKQWNPDEPWLKKMAEDVSMRTDLQGIGDEWAPREHTLRVIADCIYPHLEDSFVVGEIGVGGGRIAMETYHKVRELHCFDISQEMMKQAQTRLQLAYSQRGGSGSLEAQVHFHLVSGGEIQLNQSAGMALDNYFDFIYSFDVFPHVDLHVLYQYLKEFHRILKPGSFAFFSTADITTVDGWSRFEKQSTASVGGFCFTSPEAVRQLIHKAGLKVIQEMPRDASNVYYNRDYCVLVQKELL